MAFPTFEALTETTVASMSTTHNISLGAGGAVSAGDLLVMVFVGSQVGGDETYTITDPSGFTLKVENQYNDGSGNNRQNTGVYAKEATGSEGGTTVNVATSASVSAVAHVFRYAAGTHNGVAGVEVGTFSEVEDGANPDPPSFSPSWGSADTTWIAVATWEDSDFFATAAPASYTNLTTEIADSTEDAVISTARRDNATATENPGTFTADAEKHQAFVIAIQPAGGGGGGPDTGDWYEINGGTDYYEVNGGTDWWAINGVEITGTAAITLGNDTSAAAGSMPVTGTAAPTLGNDTSAAAGSMPVTGTAANTLQNATSAATGVLGHTGTVSTTLQDATSAATGVVADINTTGTAAVTLEDATSAASGTSQDNITGTSAVTLADATSAASGFTGFEGSAVVTLDDATSAASGFTFLPITGTVAVTLEDVLAVALAIAYRTDGPVGGIVGGGVAGTGTRVTGAGGTSSVRQDHKTSPRVAR